MRILNNIDGLPFRQPKAYEIAYVARWFETYNNSRISFRSKLSWVLCVVGICLCGLIPTAQIDSVLFLFACAGGCFISAFMCTKSKKNIRRANDCICRGNFFVMNGRVTKICSADKVGCVSVYFCSDDNSFSYGWFRVRCENVVIGTPLQLIYMKILSEKEKIFRALTPYMVSENGVGLEI